jgi:hypothetical protein
MTRDPLEGVQRSNMDTRTNRESLSPVRAGGSGRGAVVMAALLFCIFAAVTAGALVFFASKPSTTGGAQTAIPVPGPTLSPVTVPSATPTPPPPPPEPNAPAASQHE